MPTRLLLDGEDLAGLMYRIRTEMGPDAVIVKAERVRTGGVAGFFAKERFELTVEVPEPQPRSPRRPGAARPAVAIGISALLDAADAAEAAPVRDAGRQAPAAQESAVAPVIGSRLSTEADAFASMLASIDDMADLPAWAAPGDPPARVLPMARFAASDAVVSSVTLDPLRAKIPHFDGRPGFALRATGGDRRALLGLGVPAALLGDGPLDENLPLSDLLARLGRPPALLRTPGAVVGVVGESRQALAVATQMAYRIGQDPHEIVLAGEMQGVAGHARRLLSPSAAARHRARVADDEQVSIVAVGVGSAAEGRSAAAALVVALGPDQAWAVLDARRKPADLRAWMHAVSGGRTFDAAAVCSIHETQEPGTVLGLGLPIGWIDGLPTTPVVWAAVLGERLDVGARWD